MIQYLISTDLVQMSPVSPLMFLSGLGPIQIPRAALSCHFFAVSCHMEGSLVFHDLDISGVQAGYFVEFPLIWIYLLLFFSHS